MTQESLTEKLAKHLMRPVDEATRQRARLHLLDWLGCVAGARRSKLHEHSFFYLDHDVNVQSAWMGNILEMDDIHRSSILHPGPIVWPAALEANQTQTLDDVLMAAVKGYETTIAVGSTFDASHYAYYHTTSTAGVFGATAAAAHIYGLSPAQTVSAFGLAGSVAGGLWQMRNEPGHAKQWHIYQAVIKGMDSCLAARSDFLGPRFILEGPQGLHAATCENPKAMAFPKQWRIHEVSFKPWGACRHAHPAIDAALELQAKLGSLDGDILIETYADAITFCDRPDPQTVNDAKFSIQHAVAVVAEKGVPELADFKPDAIAAFAEARSRVTLKTAEDITARYPEHYGARITCSGESLELVDTRGDPERPLSRDGIIGKARALIAWGRLPDVEADRAIDLALNGNDPEAIHKMLRDWLS